MMLIEPEIEAVLDSTPRSAAEIWMMIRPDSKDWEVDSGRSRTARALSSLIDSGKAEYIWSRNRRNNPVRLFYKSGTVPEVRQIARPLPKDDVDRMILDILEGRRGLIRTADITEEIDPASFGYKEPDRTVRNRLSVMEKGGMVRSIRQGRDRLWRLVRCRRGRRGSWRSSRSTGR